MFKEFAFLESNEFKKFNKMSSERLQMSPFETPKRSEKSTKELSVFKTPPDASSIGVLRRKRKVRVLEEDEYVEKVGKIIERDFFPELDKHKARCDYIDASDRNDTNQMQRLRDRFSTGRSRLESPATFDTPEIEKDNEDAQKQKQIGIDFLETASTSGSKAEDDELKGVTLDKFLSKHTSEDNENFNEIQEAEQKDLERTHSWMFTNAEQLSIESQKSYLKVPSIEDQCGERALETKPVDGWTYKARNDVFYNPRGVQMTDSEKIDLAKKEKLIVRENTRFKTNPWKLNEAQKNNLLAAAKNADLGKVGIDGKNLVDGSVTPSVNGYKLMRLDNPTPQINPEDSPFMTWGEVESTPYRLEGAEDDALPINTGAGPSFKIQDVPKRDRLALELAEKNSKFYRDKKGKAISAARTHIKTPKSITMRASTLSPAGQRLATSKLGIRIGTDKALKAAYTPSPIHRKSSRSTPTPSSRSKDLINASVRSTGTPRTPKVLEGNNSAADVSLTDNLLNLPSSSTRTPSSASKSRPRASDYM